jgi:saposin-like type B protein
MSPRGLEAESRVPCRRSIRKVGKDDFFYLCHMCEEVVVEAIDILSENSTEESIVKMMEKGTPSLSRRCMLLLTPRAGPANELHWL